MADKSNRILGVLEGDQPGPLMLFIAALHGNETHGIDAFRHIYQSLVDHKIKIKGKIVGILGNMQAIEQEERFIDYDLNRSWKEDYLKILVNSSQYYHAEDSEMMALRDVISDYEEGEYSAKVMVDLHGTSSDNGNFIVVPEDEGSHPVIQALHLPVVIDLDKYLEGTLLGYYHARGFVSFAFEGGLIGSEEAKDLHVSGIWEILDAAGVISHHDHHDLDHYEKKLKSISKDLPKVVKAFHRHWVDVEDNFKMKPGYRNFQKLQKGEELAKDKYGPIYAPQDGMIFMPLYQDAGNDGFFIVKEVEA
ncbi:MAG: succinylglutamate desuccinylase/aspartoacylase family protein [Cyclobacteriaceae bacterium]